MYTRECGKENHLMVSEASTDLVQITEAKNLLKNPTDKPCAREAYSKYLRIA